MKEIPKYESGEPELFYKLSKQKAEQLSLENIDNGFEGIQIRIWYDYALVFNRDLIVFKMVNNIWSGTHYDLTVDWNYKKLTETIKNSKKQNLTPKSGWQNFIKQLFELKIDTLPNMTSIPGLSLATDGIMYNIEYADKEKYRFYGYHLPQNHQEKAWQAKNMVNILKLIEKEFGIKPGF
jgi:hypothetical protein